nr:LCP family protein [Liquorilactobacillus oeni]
MDNQNKMERSKHSERVHSKGRKSQGHSRKRKTYFTFFLLIFVFILGFILFTLNNTYQNARKTATAIYSPNQITKVRNPETLLKNGHPISLLLLGTDTGALGRNFKGRTDTMIIMILDPANKKMTVVSLPRDGLVAVSGYKQHYPSKLNSAYDFGGSATAVSTVQQYLNVPIDFYATINMGGLENLVNAVGGITIKPLLTFSYGGYSFTKNKETHMNGAQALAYVRMRYSDPQGDYGRQQRQRQVLTTVAFSATKLQVLLKKQFFTELKKQLKTDLSFNDFILLGLKYRVATHNLISDHAQGDSAMIDSQSFEVVPEKEKQRITDLLRSSLGLESAKTGNTLQHSQKIDTNFK